MNTVRRSIVGVVLCGLAVTGALGAGEASGAKAQVGHGPGLQEVIVVFKTHFDIGYTDLASNVVEYYRTTMIDRALEVCDRSEALPLEQRFVWTMSGWPLTQILWDGQVPERRARVLKAYKEGRFVNHALAFTTHTESLELEELVRGFGFSSRLARSADLDLPRDAKMTDVPSHSWVLPTLLKQGGVEFMHIGCNGASAAPDVPLLYWWEGPDGSRVLTMYSKDYGTGLVPPEGWPHKTWLALIMAGDNVGPPKPEAVTKLLEEAKQKLPGVKIRMGRMQDFADAILKEKPDLPVIRADMPDTWIHGLLSMPRETKLARNTRPEIGTVESLGTLLSAWNVDRSKAVDLSAAYEQSLLYGEHTWGMDVKQFGDRLYGEAWKAQYASGRYQKLEASFAQHAAYARKAHDLVAPALATDLESLARAVRVEGKRIVVFNPLPWRRDGVVEAGVQGEVPGLKDAATGSLVRVRQEDATVSFVAHDLPPMGYRTYAVVQDGVSSASDLGADESARTIENTFFKVRLDPERGCVSSVLDKRRNKELVDGTQPFCFGQFLHEHFSQNEVDSFYSAYVRMKEWWVAGDFGKPGLLPAAQAPYSTVLSHGMSLEIRRDKTSVSAVMESTPDVGIAQKISLRVTLHENQPSLDLAWSIDGKQADPWPEAGWLCLPLKVASPSFRLGRLGAVIDLAKDTVRGANHEVYCLNGGMAVVAPDGSGVGLCPLDSPLVSIEHPGIWKYSKDFLPTKPLVFVNLYNNQWSTNFPQWIGGSWTSRVRLWAVDKYDTEASLVTPAREARVPLMAAFFDGPAGTLETSQAGLELSRKGVLVTAFGANPDGEGMVLRLWEQAGRDGLCEVRLPEGLKVKSVQPCDLRGRPLEKRIAVTNGRFKINLRHYAPVSLLIEPGQ